MRLFAARLFVRDLTSALEFYSGKLNLTLLAGSEELGYLVLDAGSIQLVVEGVSLDAPEEEQELIGRFSGLSFVVTDISKAVNELAGRGVLFMHEPEEQSWGGLLATFIDSAGNELQLVQYKDAA